MSEGQYIMNDEIASILYLMRDASELEWEMLMLRLNKAIEEAKQIQQAREMMRGAKPKGAGIMLTPSMFPRNERGGLALPGQEVAYKPSFWGTVGEMSHPKVGQYGKQQLEPAIQSGGKSFSSALKQSASNFGSELGQGFKQFGRELKRIQFPWDSLNDMIDEIGADKMDAIIRFFIDQELERYTDPYGTLPQNYTAPAPVLPQPVQGPYIPPQYQTPQQTGEIPLAESNLMLVEIALEAMEPESRNMVEAKLIETWGPDWRDRLTEQQLYALNTNLRKFAAAPAALWEHNFNWQRIEPFIWGGLMTVPGVLGVGAAGVGAAGLGGGALYSEGAQWAKALREMQGFKSPIPQSFMTQSQLARGLGRGARYSPEFLGQVGESAWLAQKNLLPEQIMAQAQWASEPTMALGQQIPNAYKPTAFTAEALTPTGYSNINPQVMNLYTGMSPEITPGMRAPEIYAEMMRNDPELAKYLTQQRQYQTLREGTLGQKLLGRTPYYQGEPAIGYGGTWREQQALREAAGLRQQNWLRRNIGRVTGTGEGTLRGAFSGGTRAIQGTEGTMGVIPELRLGGLLGRGVAMPETAAGISAASRVGPYAAARGQAMAGYGLGEMGLGELVGAGDPLLMRAGARLGGSALGRGAVAVTPLVANIAMVVWAGHDYVSMTMPSWQEYNKSKGDNWKNWVPVEGYMFPHNTMNINVRNSLSQQDLNASMKAQAEQMKNLEAAWNVISQPSEWAPAAQYWGSQIYEGIAGLPSAIGEWISPTQQPYTGLISEQEWSNLGQTELGRQRQQELYEHWINTGQVEAQPAP